MIIIKKVDTENKIVTVSNNDALQSINLSEFLTVPNVNDIVEPQKNDSDGTTKFVVVNNVFANNSNLSSKSKMVAGLLGIFLGTLGIHNFYLGHAVKGVCQLLLGTLGWLFFAGWIATLWGFIEGIIIICSQKGSNWHKDAQGHELSD